jgi:hypothetical protein
MAVRLCCWDRSRDVIFPLRYGQIKDRAMANAQYCDSPKPVDSINLLGS